MNGGHDMAAVPATATIIALRPLSGDTTFYRLQLEDKVAAQNFTFVPGQFTQLSVPAGGEVPISLAGIPRPDGVLELCIRRAGHVTSLLHGSSPGAKVGIRGPFGNGFPVDEWHGRNILILAGGLGIAPLRSLLYFILRSRSDYGEITFMYGAREPSAILFKEELAELSGRKDLHLFLTVDFATEEPESGLTCHTGLLPTLLRGVNITVENTVAAVCGPPALYRCIIAELDHFGFPAESVYLSLERRMKCGVGRCCHCAVGDLFCCTDGPVFRVCDVRGIEGAL
jgi:NAD(P)H-flavin reductase